MFLKGSRIQQVTSSSNSIQRRSGNVLPPPEDGTPIVKSAMYTNHNSATSGRTSPPNSSSGRSATLPAGSSWGTRPCSSQPLQTSSPSSNGPLDQITDTCDSPVAFSKAVTSQVYSLQNGTGKKNVPKEESTISQVKSKPEAFGSFKKESDADGNIVSDTSMNSVNAIVPLSSELHSPRRTKSLLNTSNICDSPATSSGLASKYNTDNGLENVCSDTLSLNIEENQHLQNDDVEHIREPSICRTPEEVKNNTDAVHIASVQSDSISGRTDQLTEVYLPELDDLLSFHKQRIKDPEIACSRAPDFSDAFNITHSDFDSPVFGNANVLIGNGFHRQVVDRSINLIVSTSNRDNIFNNGAEDSNLFLGKQKMSPVGGHDPEEGSGAIDIGESSIISSILSMDFDSWDVPVTSPQNLAKFLGETNRRRGSLGETGSSITQNSGGSRFSFAREEAIGHLHSEQSADHEHSFNHHLFGHNYSSSNRLHPEKSVSSNRLHLEKSVSTNGLHDFSALEQDGLATNHSHITSNKLSVPRPQVSAPPGFSVSSRAAPPGFNTHGKTEQVVKSHSGNYAFDTLLRNQYQIPSGGDTYTNGDTEFMDPAILAVGKGTFASGIDITGLDIIPNFPPQFNTFDEAALRSILQRSMPSHDNQRFSGLGDGLSTLGDAYGISSRIVEQTLSNNASPFSQFTIPQSRNGISSNGQWDGWNEAWGVNHLGVAELLRSERLGFNDKYFSEESRMRMSGSGNIYNGTYGI